MTPANNTARASGHIHLFVYGTLRGRGGTGAEVLAGCERVRKATVRGSLYHLGDYPALVLAGDESVTGEIWRLPADRLHRLDAYEGVDTGLFRRVALAVDGVACWLYVAGPALARRLTPRRRIVSGEWRPPLPCTSPDWPDS